MHDSSTSSLLTLPPKQPYRINNCMFQNSMLSFLSDLHSSKAYADVVLSSTEGKLIHAHRVVLAAGSSYFNTLFKSLMTADSRQQHQRHDPSRLVIALPNVKYKDLEKVVRFVYYGYLDIVNSELEGFVNLAKQLGVVGMADDEHDPPAAPPPDQPQPLDHEIDEKPVVLAHNDAVTTSNATLLRDYDPAISPEESVHDIPPSATLLSVVDPDNEDLVPHHEVNSRETPYMMCGSSSSPLPPNDFLQLNYTDDEDELEEGDELLYEDDLLHEGLHRLEDDMEDDYENSTEGYLGNSNPGISSSQQQQLQEQQQHANNNARFGNTTITTPNNSTIDVKPFACLKCGKMYNSNKSLWRHKKFTCDEKIEFKCNVCGKVFSRSDNLRRHVVVAHS